MKIFISSFNRMARGFVSVAAGALLLVVAWSGIVHAAGCNVTIGDLVWNDQNGNGIQDAGEPGIDGLTVRLTTDGVTTALDFNGHPAITTTGTPTQHGYYQFTSICPGTYTVVVDETNLPKGFKPTTSPVGADPGKDSNVNPAKITIATNGTSEQTIDFGYLIPCKGTIGDTVWLDKNRNGKQDFGVDVGIAGVTVLLYQNGNPNPQTSITDGNGKYSFNGVCPNIPYTVKVGSAPSNYTPIIQSSDGNDFTPDDSNDPNGTAVTLLTSDTGAIINNPTVDFGYVAPCEGAIGDYVWLDKNRNGVQDTGDTGIKDIEVQLLDQSGNLQPAVAVTDGNGYYRFSAVCPYIDYTVKVVSSPLLSNYTPISPFSNSGNDLEPADSNNPDGTAVTLPTTTGEMNNLTVDFGYTPPLCDGVIGNRVWLDQNRNGIDDNEPGIAAVTVGLYAENNVLIGTTDTDGNGDYRFSNICPNILYTVKVNTPPSGFTPTSIPVIGGGNIPPSGDGNVLVDKDSNDPMGTTVMLPTSDNQNSNLTVDFGYVAPCTGTIGDSVWLDLNRDGIQDDNEPGIPKVTLQLFDSLFQIYQTAITDPYGRYQFNGLCPDILYKVTVVPSSLPEGYYLTSPHSSSSGNDGIGNAGIDKDCNNPELDGTAVTLSTDLLTNSTVDFGYIAPLVGISIVKYTNGIDAPTAPGPDVVVGSTVNWTYIVTNYGEVPLSNVTVTDDMGVVVVCPLTSLNAGETMTCNGSGTAMLDQYKNIGTATGFGIGKTVTASYASHYRGVAPSITIKKLTNGVDAPTAPGPTLAVGSTVTWSYIVTNNSNVNLTSVFVTDSKGVAVTCPGSTLAVGASMTCTGTGIATDGQYGNIGTAIGTGAGKEVTASYASHYLGVTGPSITIQKLTNNIDAPIAPGPTLTVGSAVTWSYIVTNNGSVALSSVIVTDNMGVKVCCPSTTLAAGKSMTCTGKGTATSGQYENIGTVTGSYGCNKKVTASYKSHYLGVGGGNPSITIKKLTNNIDAPTAPGPTLSVGSSVIWSYLVTNNGTAALSSVSVTDNMGVKVCCPKTKLAIGESMTCTGKGTATAGQYENIGTATGSYACNKKVTASYASHYFGQGATGTVGTGDTATIGFWHNKNGQALIKALNGGPSSTNLANWLASNFPNLYGASAGCNNLTGKTNADVAALFQKFFAVCGQKLDAQTLAVALACYVTNSNLAGTTATSYGFKVTATGTGAKQYNVGTYGLSICLKNNTLYTVMQLLQQANLKKKVATCSANSFNVIFSGINQLGDIK